ncbi:hypothetical protein R1sor_025805 [Riccia sorocarpa]|uniref:Phytanoyl-CoA dioxygenase n=1 Tax=Riccia sorocarpa TaxID=122646 RepID=A0ABD3G9M3_9MARC
MGAENNYLTLEQLEFYEKNGYLVVEKFASQDECKEMMQRMGELLGGFTPENKSIFSTKKQEVVNSSEHSLPFQLQTTDNFFRRSANNISFFFEEKAFDEDGNLRQPKELSINKVGHALHDLDPVFRKFSRSDRITGLVASLGYKKPLPIQSMYIFKQPGIGGEVRPHQDSTFLYTYPYSCTGFWLALENANVENGCLWALPGSHSKGKLAKKFVIQSDGTSVMEGAEPTYDMSKLVPLEVKAGSLVLLHGLLVHQSFENTSPKSRHAYSVHVIEGDGTVYPEENWLQRDPGFPFEPLYSCARVGRQAS